MQYPSEATCTNVRVAYICADAGVPVFGTKGCSVHVQEIVNQFLGRGGYVTLFALRSGGDRRFDSSRFELREFPIGSNAAVRDRETDQQNAAHKIAQQLSAERFDVVYERYSLWSAQPICRARELGIPTVLEVNAPLIEEQAQHRELIQHGKAVTIRNQVFQAATTIVAVSEQVAEYVRSCLPIQDHSKVHVVANGVDVQRFHPDVRPTDPNEQFTVGFLGTLKPWHGLESLLAAFHLVHLQRPTVKLRIIGDGPMRASLQQQVLTEYPHMHTNIEWIGAVQPCDVPGHLSAVDVAVAPYLDSPDFYFSPLKVYEYMAAGRAVIASSIGQLRAALDHGRTGLLYPPGDVDALAKLLLQLVDQPALCRQLGAAAREVAESRHSWQQTLNTILRHLELDHASHIGHDRACHVDSDWVPAVGARL